MSKQLEQEFIFRANELGDYLLKYYSEVFYNITTSDILKETGISEKIKNADDDLSYEDCFEVLDIKKDVFKSYIKNKVEDFNKRKMDTFLDSFANIIKL